MKLNSPKQITWIIALILLIVGLLGFLVIAAIQGIAFWIVVVGLVLMLAATYFPGL
jgi:hypothetical protein